VLEQAEPKDNKKDAPKRNVKKRVKKTR
jgi:hypothetical protein